MTFKAKKLKKVEIVLIRIERVQKGFIPALIAGAILSIPLVLFPKSNLGRLLCDSNKKIFFYIKETPVPFFLISTICLTIIIILLSIRKRIKGVHKKSQKIVNGIESALKHTDYYYNNFVGGLGIDIEAKKIAIVQAFQKTKVQNPIIFNFNEIKTWKIRDPGYTKYSGGSSGQSSEKTLNSMRQAYSETGLYFYLDNLELPKVFAPMEYDVGESWMLLVEKMLDGTLEKKDNSQRFPSGK